MKYKAGNRRRAAEYERALVEWWKKNKTFEKSVEERPIDDSYVFYDGPPFITGMPHHGTLLSSIVKDAVPRFWTMRGKRVERRWGWDCHGLPAENFVEKQLGITDRREVGTKWSLEEYITKARESMVANSETWEGTIERIGRWVDFRGAYRTMDRDFMESVWWAFKTLYEAGKIYEGAKVLMYDTKFATPVSKSEVTMDNDAYQTVTDPSAYVKFRLAEPAAFLETVGAAAGRQELASRRKSCEVLKELRCGASAQKKKRVFSSLALLPQGADVTALTFAKQISDDAGTSKASQTADASARRTFSNVDSPNVSQKADGSATKTYMLAWTTTPWTLPGNMALAVNAGMEYGVYEVGEEKWIVAEKCAERAQKAIGGEWTKIGSVTGAELAGLAYEALEIAGGEECDKGYYESEWGKAHRVYVAEFVGDAEGTGIVHIAPAYGEDDYALARENGVPCVDVLDEYGCYVDEVKAKLMAAGVRPNENGEIQTWEANKFIAKVLEERGVIAKIEYVKHDYPFNPRSKTRIMYRAVPSWFFDVQGQKAMMLEQNENINWFPGYLKHGRFSKNIEQAPDWNLSRDRFWATAMPVWKGEKTGAVVVVGSYDELERLSGVRLEDYHRPWVDKIEFDAVVNEAGEAEVTIPLETVASAGQIRIDHFKRVDKVLDCWFESGSMPFAQLHYPFENKEKFERNYPADFIVEYVGQVRAWFYYVHAVNTALAECGAFGEKFAKSYIMGCEDIEDELKKLGVEFVAEKDGDETNYAARVPMSRAEDFEKLICEKMKPGFFNEYIVDGRGVFVFKKADGGVERYVWGENERGDEARIGELVKEMTGKFDGVREMWRENEFYNEDILQTTQKNAFKNVITTGTLAGNDGRKMSKSLGNYTDPNELMDKFSADALRFLLLSSPVLSGEDFALTDKDVSDTQRKLAMIWNVYDFFTMYAEVDGWESDGGEVEEIVNPLDRWIIARMNELIKEVTEGMEEYNIPKAMGGVLPFVDDLSNWFVRRSRRRFWKSEDDGDKSEAYAVLWKVMVELAKVLAPFTPFLAEELWQNLAGGWDKDGSVHLEEWPKVGVIDETVLEEMKRVREVINEGLRMRMVKSETEEQVKVRQPLGELVYDGEKLPEWGAEIVKDEVNVKRVTRGEKMWIDKEITEELAREGWARELVRAVQSARKKAGLNVDDRIRLSVDAEVPAEWREMVMAETLAEELVRGENFAYDEIVKVDGVNVAVSLERG